jgi:hypothetical protein
MAKEEKNGAPIKSAQEMLADYAKTAASAPPVLKCAPHEAPPHIIAKYVGTYYHAVGSKESTQKPFVYHERVPMEWVLDPKQTPISIFVQHFSKRSLRRDTGTHRTQNICLADTEGLDVSTLAVNNHTLNWVTRYEDLAKIAKAVDRTYIPYSPDANEAGYTVPEPSKAVFRLELWPDVDELRNAIKLCLKDPEAFMKSQQVRADKGHVTQMIQANETLQKLGYN